MNMKFSTALLALVLVWARPSAAVDYTYTVNNGVVTITAYTGPGGAVTIPSTINGLPVTGIGEYAFYYCGSLTSVTIPNGVTDIGVYAFAVCYSLISVTIPDSVTSIGYATFAGCGSLTSVTIPNGVTDIGVYAFSDCSGLTSITIPDSVISIWDRAFLRCSSLTNAIIGKSITGIGAAAFVGCNLTSAYFKGNAFRVSSEAFYGNNYLTVYYLPGTTGWGTTFDGHPTALWVVPRPQVSTFGVRTNQFGFFITGTSNQAVVIEACTNLACPTWVAAGTNTLAGGSSYFSDPGWTNHPGRFYRLRSL